MKKEVDAIEDLEKSIELAKEMKFSASIDASVSLGVMLVITYFTYTLSDLPQFEQYSNIIFGCLIAGWVLSVGAFSMFSIIAHVLLIKMTKELKEKSNVSI